MSHEEKHKCLVPECGQQFLWEKEVIHSHILSKHNNLQLVEYFEKYMNSPTENKTENKLIPRPRVQVCISKNILVGV